MSWARAKEVLEGIIEEMTNPAVGREWLNRLEKAECKDAYRLGFCIAIDVASGALTRKVYADILDRMDSNEACPRRAFAKAFKDHPQRRDLICSSQHRVEHPDESRFYIRVLSLRDFITYYKPDRTLAPDDVEAIRKQYFSEHIPRDLSDIREWWSGANGVVWVMSEEEYEDLAGQHRGSKLASLLNDALGLGKEHSNGHNDGMELVGVKYPRDFDQPALQPTALDAYWMDFGWYFVSYGKDDGWGRTVSCSGEYERPLRERVHSEFEKLTAEYVGFPIGNIAPQKKDRKKLLDNADSRLESILPPPVAP